MAVRPACARKSAIGRKKDRWSPAGVVGRRAARLMIRCRCRKPSPRRCISVKERGQVVRAVETDEHNQQHNNNISHTIERESSESQMNAHSLISRIVVVGSAWWTLALSVNRCDAEAQPAHRS